MLGMGEGAGLGRGTVGMWGRMRTAGRPGTQTRATTHFHTTASPLTHLEPKSNPASGPRALLPPHIPLDALDRRSGQMDTGPAWVLGLTSRPAGRPSPQDCWKLGQAGWAEAAALDMSPCEAAARKQRRVRGVLVYRVYF